MPSAASQTHCSGELDAHLSEQIKCPAGKAKSSTWIEFSLKYPETRLCVNQSQEEKIPTYMWKRPQSLSACWHWERFPVLQCETGRKQWKIPLMD